ncbi:hypothetical protein M9H77_24560 [Catharanthus roseus]|uniref:Uncharacterized protein n=1 Tax=Catharanthus roseus TaxID=4058 RepID=A0ACC0AZ56_CATRO|nr:hypothetical protein M9H77_24560 [Catharanthus roseus]
MAALPRSEVSFRRQGSSGLVWDDKLLSGELKKISTEENNKPKVESKPAAAYKTLSVEPAEEPPSPRVSGCGICGFGKKKPQTKSHNRKKPATAADDRSSSTLLLMWGV